MRILSTVLVLALAVSLVASQSGKTYFLYTILLVLYYSPYLLIIVSYCLLTLSFQALLLKIIYLPTYFFSSRLESFEKRSEYVQRILIQKLIQL